MSYKNKTLADWPIGTSGKTARGHGYEIVHHNKNGTKQILSVLFLDEGVQHAMWYGVNTDFLIHPDDAGVSILDDLSNPEGIPVCKLDIESRKALDKVGWAGLDIKFPNRDEWEPSKNSAQDAPLSSKAGMSSIAYRVRPQPKFRLMTPAEAREWAAMQPVSVLVRWCTATAAPAQNWGYGATMENFRWVDVDKGGGWKPLPMVEG